MNKVSEEEKFEQFIAHVTKVPISSDTDKRIETLARELAEGAKAEIWEPSIVADRRELIGTEVSNYLTIRWNNQYPSPELLDRYGYLERYSGGYHITKAAFDLTKATPPTTIFISYKRSESSAFALLVLHRLKEAGLDAFLDIKLETGEPWHPELEERIKGSDNFVVLLGAKTLESRWVCKEIEWAITEKKRILPIWQPGFSTNDSSQWQFELDEVYQSIQRIQGIKVLEDSPSGYHKV
jgi:hypothetical protein